LAFTFSVVAHNYLFYTVKDSLSLVKMSTVEGLLEAFDTSQQEQFFKVTKNVTSTRRRRCAR
jgi:hypothetical protein